MPYLWIVGGGGAALEAWAVLRSRSFDAPGIHCGFITPEGSVAFPLEGLACRSEGEFLASARPADEAVFLAVGDPGLRCRLAEKFGRAGFRSPTLIHPTAIIGPGVEIGEGTLVMAGAVLETHLSIGRHCFLNVQSSVGHESRVGDFCNLGPGVHLPGRVRVGDRSDLGTGCAFRPGIEIGPDTVVGAGAVVVRNTPGRRTLVGVPAVPLERAPGPLP